MDYQLISPVLPDKNMTVVETVFSNRGIDPQNIEHYLHTTDEDICDPKLIMNIQQGAQMLVKHISQKDLIFFQVDSDCDGFTSSAILINYLNCLFPGYAQNNILYRIHTGKQHGIIPNTIPEGVKLVIAPDSSSNDYEEHKLLRAKGIDVLVIDHHEAEKISENACIVNNQLCDYPTKSLSGAGMVYKFCSYIDEILGTKEADNFLDLAALGMIADMMDLRDYETKRLIDKGLASIRNPFFKQMIQVQNFSINKHGGLDPFAISFYIAPQVNGTIRMGNSAEKMTLFESMLDFKAYEQIPSTKRGCKGQMETRVEQACRNCVNIKNRQQKARDNSLTALESIIEEDNLLNHKFLIIKIKPEYHVDKNLTGLIANQLMAKYQRPVLLLNKVVNENGDITWEGSGRGYDKSAFKNFKEYLNQTGLVMYAEGHASAFGVGVTNQNFDKLVYRSDFDLDEFEFSPSYNVDMIYHGSNFNGKDIIDIANLKSVWGQGIEEPLIAITGVNITSQNIILMSKDKNPTLKIVLSNGVELISFKSSEEEFQKLCPEGNGCTTISLVGKCEQNYWGGKTTPQILIEEYEIDGQSKYYF